MLILLPPSEGKASPADDLPPVALERLAFAEQLNPVRNRLLDLLERQGKIDPKRAAAALGISKGQIPDIALSAALRGAPAAPAAAVYSGVLYERLALSTLPVAAKRRAEAEVLIASALWGMLRPSDPIPYYRLSASAKLPRLGGLAAFWRPKLRAAFDRAELDRTGELILDLRSSGYAAAWKPAQAELVAIRAFSEDGGRRRVISHMAKAARGDVARLVLLKGLEPSDSEDLAGMLEAAGYRIELGPGSIDLIDPL